MGKQDEQLLLAGLGLALLIGGHKLLNTELGRLGAPHVLGAVLLAAALKT